MAARARTGLRRAREGDIAARASFGNSPRAQSLVVVAREPNVLAARATIGHRRARPMFHRAHRVAVDARPRGAGSHWCQTPAPEVSHEFVVFAGLSASFPGPQR